MNQILDILQNPIVTFAIAFGLGMFVKNKSSKGYYKLASLLIDAIETIDDDIKDCISEDQRKKLTKIKQWVNSKIEAEEKKILDTMLVSKGMRDKNKED